MKQHAHTCEACGQPLQKGDAGGGAEADLAALLAEKLGGAGGAPGGGAPRANPEDAVLDDLIERTGEWGAGPLKKPEDEEFA